jgi:hypothetical protein
MNSRANYDNEFTEENLNNTESEFIDSVQMEAESKERTLSLLTNVLKERCESISEEAESEDENNNNNNGNHAADMFTSIPLPQHLSSDFQRVTISNASESVDPDTIIACKTLLKCMKLREKWQAGYLPVTNLPSEVEIIRPTKISMSSFRDGSNYWRRPEPIYDLFNKSIPPGTKQFSYEMINGVTHVYLKNTTATSATDPSSSSNRQQLFTALSFEQFVNDFITVSNVI